jgi:hypothetical protein
MYAATLCFLGIAGLILVASSCLSMGKQAAATDRRATMSKRPTWDQKAEWPEIKATWMRWYAQCQAWEAPKQSATLSWGRTMALCAGLCLVGIVLKVKLDEQMSASRIRSDFMHQPRAVTRFQTPRPQGKTVRAVSQRSS